MRVVEKELDDYAELMKDHSQYSSLNRGLLQEASADLNWAAIAVGRAKRLLDKWRKLSD